MFKDSSINDVLLTFMYDVNCDRLLLFYRSEEKLNNNGYKLKVYNEKKSCLEFEVDVTSEDLIGRFKSGSYTFADGHIFYQNNVIKIRYDLIQSNESDRYSEREIFDVYHGIFEIEPHMKVKCDSPLNSIQSHRLAYIFSDRTHE